MGLKQHRQKKPPVSNRQHNRPLYRLCIDHNHGGEKASRIWMRHVLMLKDFSAVWPLAASFASAGRRCLKAPLTACAPLTAQPSRVSGTQGPQVGPLKRNFPLSQMWFMTTLFFFFKCFFFFFFLSCRCQSGKIQWKCSSPHDTRITGSDAPFHSTSCHHCRFWVFIQLYSKPASVVVLHLHHTAAQQDCQPPSPPSPPLSSHLAFGGIAAEQQRQKSDFACE